MNVGRPCVDTNPRNLHGFTVVFREQGRLGMTNDSLTPQGGVQVVAVTPNSQASEFPEIRPGVLLVAVSNTPVLDAQ